MSEYFMMDCWGLADDEPYQSPKSNNTCAGGMSWALGRVAPSEVEQPIEMQWSDETSGGGEYWKMFGSPTDGPKAPDGMRRLWAYPYKNPPLYHRAVHEGLLAAGVTNLDVYETRITGKAGEVCTDYLAVNIIGLVQAADMGKSKAVSHSPDGLIDTDFDSVVLKEGFSSELKMFRMAESVNAVIVHKSVKEHLGSLGGFGLTFTKPEDWIG